MEGLWNILKQLFDLLQKIFGNDPDKGAPPPKQEGYFEDGYVSKGYHKKEEKRNG